MTVWQEKVFVIPKYLNLMNWIRQRNQLHLGCVSRGLGSDIECAVWRAPVLYRSRLMRALHPVAVNLTTWLRHVERFQTPSRDLQGAYLQLHLNSFCW